MVVGRVLLLAATPASALPGDATGSAALTVVVDLGAIPPPADFSTSHFYNVAVGELQASDNTPTIFGIGRSAPDGSSEFSDATASVEDGAVNGMRVGVDVHPVGLAPTAASGIDLRLFAPVQNHDFIWTVTGTWAYELVVDLEGACGSVSGVFSKADPSTGIDSDIERRTRPGFACTRSCCAP